MMGLLRRSAFWMEPWAQRHLTAACGLRLKTQNIFMIICRSEQRWYLINPHLTRTEKIQRRMRLLCEHSPHPLCIFLPCVLFLSGFTVGEKTPLSAFKPSGCRNQLLCDTLCFLFRTVLKMIMSINTPIPPPVIRKASFSPGSW